MHRQYFRVVDVRLRLDVQDLPRQVHLALVCDRDYPVHLLSMHLDHQRAVENFLRLHLVDVLMLDVRQNLVEQIRDEGLTFLDAVHLHRQVVVVGAALHCPLKMDYFLDAQQQVRSDEEPEDVEFQMDYFLDAVHEVPKVQAHLASHLQSRL